MNIRQDANVKVSGGQYDGLTGRVRTVYDTLDIAIVTLETGDVAKIFLEHLVEYEPRENADEIPEGAKRITEAMFKAALAEVTQLDEDTYLDKLAAAIQGMSIKKDLFKETDEIVITSNEFVVKLWELCSPQNIAGAVRDKQNYSDAFSVSVKVIAVLEDLVEVLFNEG